MTTEKDLIAQAKRDNPKPLYRTDNGVQTELTDAEYDEAITKWAEMRLEQLTVEQAEADKQAAKESAKAKLAALGLTEAEVSALLSTTTNT